MALPITIEQQVKELKTAGWTSANGHIWLTPSGEWFIGPYGAWKVMRGMDATGKVLRTALDAPGEDESEARRG